MRTIRNIYEADQADRRDTRLSRDLDRISSRDEMRRTEIVRIIAVRKRLTPEERYMIAMIYQHGPKISHAILARRYAMSAMKAGHERSKWLYAAATDRLCFKQGKAQKYGTQFVKKNEKSPWKLHPVDPRITDHERAQFNVPPLAAAKKRVIAMNTMRR